MRDMSVTLVMPLPRQERRAGFTLVEMLVVIGIIGILMASLIKSFSYLQNSARQSQAQELVSNAATAFAVYLQNEGRWPQEFLDSNGEFDEKVCGLFQKTRTKKVQLLDVTTYLTTDVDASTFNVATATPNPNSLDRFGLLDPYGRQILKRNSKASLGDVQKHRLQFRLDTNLDGKVDSSDDLGNTPGNIAIRASAIVWSRGPDGKDDDANASKYPKDDRLSWVHRKEAGGSN